MVKLVAMYGKPRDPAHFDRYYREVHVPLAKRIPGLKRFTIHNVLGSPQEGEPPYYCLTEVYWKDLGTARKALAWSETDLPCPSEPRRRSRRRR